MNAREQILRTLRCQIVPDQILPDLSDRDWIRFEDPWLKFREMVEFAGGACKCLDSISEVPRELQRMSISTDGHHILSLVPELAGNIDLESLARPHELKNLALVICRAQLAVAETGAVWLTDDKIKHRACFFIAEMVVVLIDPGSIVHNMIEAYHKIQPPVTGFGMFLAGPSKTADIEQSLVVGAHGAKALQVFIVE